MTSRAGKMGSVWLRRPQPAGDRRPGQAKIVAEAVAVLGAEGLDGLSMRDLAGGLRSPALSSRPLRTPSLEEMRP
ncbi:hypothetical protein HNP84_002631 [Thermocatellispora tengchongensis]|uniref:Uncharacterized protein n=1 Tax=Thermocatellispora tengchongensis TaxID=1073253 RepID=A0A840P609_9ACTN|nr:hypothetical protein [Thermocatellispora tengchongensis]MBB5132910.1 hypothetical protein [Thermocatellispora tengchongensis]